MQRQQAIGQVENDPLSTNSSAWEFSTMRLVKPIKLVEWDSVQSSSSNIFLPLSDVRLYT